MPGERIDVREAQRVALVQDERGGRVGETDRVRLLLCRARRRRANDRKRRDRADDAAPHLTLNAPRIMLASASNVAAVAIFIIAGAVRWPQTLIMLVAGVIGGYGGARLGRVLPGPVIRAATIICAAAITIAFFVRAYSPHN